MLRVLIERPTKFTLEILIAVVSYCLEFRSRYVHILKEYGRGAFKLYTINHNTAGQAFMTPCLELFRVCN